MDALTDPPASNSPKLHCLQSLARSDDLLAYLYFFGHRGAHGITVLDNELRRQLRRPANDLPFGADAEIWTTSEQSPQKPQLSRETRPGHGHGDGRHHRRQWPLKNRHHQCARGDRSRLPQRSPGQEPGDNGHDRRCGEALQEALHTPCRRHPCHEGRSQDPRGEGHGRGDGYRAPCFPSPVIGNPD